MPGDRIVKTTSVSWFSRIRQSVAGVFVGLLLIPVALVLLFWNEGRAVMTAKALAEGADIVVSVDSGTIDPLNDGLLVHVSGMVTANGTPFDHQLGIMGQGLRLDRKVEMFQWKEHQQSSTRTKLGGGEETVTTYTYTKEWSEKAIDSARFTEPDGHDNPSMPLVSTSFPAPDGQIGVFRLNGAQISEFGRQQPLLIDSARAETIRTALGTDRQTEISAGSVVFARNPDHQEIGDIRVTYTETLPAEGSIVAAQHGNRLEPYKTQAGRDLYLTANGAVSAEDMFEAAVTDNVVLTWILRLVGFVVLYVGFSLILAIFAVLADVIPPVGALVRLGAGLVALIPTILFGAIDIAIAWIFYRPFIAMAIVVAAGFISAGLWCLKCQRVPAEP